jgi:inorganic pyrophosphatase
MPDPGAALGVFWMRDEKGRDSKVLAVPSSDVRQEATDIDQHSRALLLQIGHFFEVYKALEPGKSSEVHGWDGRSEAEPEIERARDRYRTGSR